MRVAASGRCASAGALLMGTSIAMIDRTYVHLARDSEEAIRARLDARAGRSDVLRTPSGEQARTGRAATPLSKRDRG
jgi:hypothetical protein